MKRLLLAAVVTLASVSLADSADKYKAWLEWRNAQPKYKRAQGEPPFLGDLVPDIKLAPGSHLTEWNRDVNKCCVTVSVANARYGWGPGIDVYRDLIFDADGRLCKIRPAYISTHGIGSITNDIGFSQYPDGWESSRTYSRAALNTNTNSVLRSRSTPARDK